MISNHIMIIAKYHRNFTIHGFFVNTAEFNIGYITQFNYPPKWGGGARPYRKFLSILRDIR